MEVTISTIERPILPLRVVSITPITPLMGRIIERPMELFPLGERVNHLDQHCPLCQGEVHIGFSSCGHRFCQECTNFFLNSEYCLLCEGKYDGCFRIYPNRTECQIYQYGREDTALIPCGHCCCDCCSEQLDGKCHYC